MIQINNDQALAMGISTHHEKMDNGELRFRLSTDSSSYILTRSSDQPKWQNSHFHTVKKEWYLVEKGEILIARIIQDKVILTRLRKEHSLLIEPSVIHNVFLYPDTVLHALKLGKTADSDWHPAKALDSWLDRQNIQKRMKDSDFQEIPF